MYIEVKSNDIISSFIQRTILSCATIVSISITLILIIVTFPLKSSNDPVMFISILSIAIGIVCLVVSIIADICNVYEYFKNKED